MDDILNLIKNHKIKHRIEFNIDNWRDNSDWLWGKDPNKLMIDHGLRHAESLMTIMEQMLSCYFDKIALSDLELYCLISSAWLHDIGCAYENESDKDKVRREHSKYSMERIIHDPDKLICIERELKYIIAEICLYHSSKTPLSSKQAHEYKAQGFSFCEDPIVEKREVFYRNDKYIIRSRLLAALLSVADACDIGGQRIGDIEIKKEYLLNVGKENGSSDEINNFIKHYSFHELVSNIYFLENEIIIEPRPVSSEDDLTKIRDCINTLLWHDIERANEVLSIYSIAIKDISIGTREKLKEVFKEEQQSTLKENAALKPNTNYLLSAKNSLIDMNTSKINDVMKNVVKIKTNLRMGTGIVIDDKGTIITNYHVIESADKIEIEFDKDCFAEEVKVHSINAEIDSAILKCKFPPHINLCEIAFGNEQYLTVGDEVIAFGCPKGPFEKVFSNGIVTSVEKNQRRIQFIASVSQGFSGGPIFNKEYELIGIIVSGFVCVNAQSRCFFIPINNIKAELSQNNEVSISLKLKVKTDSPIISGYYDNESNKYYSSHIDGSIREWNDNLQESQNRIKFKNAIKSFAITDNISKKKMLIALNESKSVKMYDISASNVVILVNQIETDDVKMSVSNNLPILVAGNNKGVMHFYDFSSDLQKYDWTSSEIKEKICYISNVNTIGESELCVTYADGSAGIISFEIVDGIIEVREKRSFIWKNNKIGILEISSNKKLIVMVTNNKIKYSMLSNDICKSAMNFEDICETRSTITSLKIGKDMRSFYCSDDKGWIYQFEIKRRNSG